jgi:hypothetical protein
VLVRVSFAGHACEHVFVVVVVVVATTAFVPIVGVVHADA